MYEISLIVLCMVIVGAVITFMRKREKREEQLFRVQTEQELEKARKAMLEEKEIRQEFFVNVSHELKTPITSIKGYSELLAQGFVTTEEEREEFYRRILSEANSMCELIEDSLEISRLESKEVQPKRTTIRVCLLLEEIMDSLRPMAEQYRIVLHKECEPMTIYADVKQMTTLLKNLIANGIKYNRSGGEVWVYALKQNEKMMLVVKDNGIGIGEEDQKHIFERFYRVDKGRSRKTGGTGLGLSIVKHIVKYNGGTIEVESKLGKGSRFVVWLPVIQTM